MDNNHRLGVRTNRNADPLINWLDVVKDVRTIHALREAREKQSAQTGLTTSDDLPKNNKKPDPFKDSFYYGLVQAPLSGVTQLADKMLGTTLESKVTSMKPPSPAEFGSKDWHLQQLGTVAGMLPLVLAVHKGSSKLASRFYGPAGAELALQSNAKLLTRNAVLDIGTASLTGLIVGGVLTPVSQNENFFAARGRNGLTGGIALGTMSASAHALYSVGLRNRTVIGAMSGASSGFIAAESSSILYGTGFAKQSDVLQSVSTNSLLGGSLGAIASIRNYAGLHRSVETPGDVPGKTRGR